MTTLLMTHVYPATIELRSGATMVAIEGDSEHPKFPFDNGSIASIDAVDVLEHVADEETWLLECARVLRPGGRLRMQVPRRGVTSWFESLNMYRYLVDVLGRGHDPLETKPIGWHRQYREADLRAMLEKTGFTVCSIHQHSVGLAEIPTLGRLVIGDMIRNDRATELRARESRVGLDAVDARIPAGPLSRRIVVTARR